MNDMELLILTIASEALLLLSFILIYKLTKKTMLNVILLIIGGAPLLYMAIDHTVSNYPDANIGLGFAFYYTWIYAAVAFIVAISLLLTARKK